MTVPTPYGLPNGALFVENFNSPATVAANGGVVTGTGLANGRYRPVGTGMINYPTLAGALARLKKLTICTVATFEGFTGSYRTLLCVHTTAGDEYEVGVSSGSNVLYWYDGSSVVTFATVTPGRHSFTWACDGTNTLGYMDGVLLESKVAGSGTHNPAGLTMNVGSNYAGSQPFAQSIRTLQIYGSYLDQPSILDWHRSSLRYL